MRLTVPVTLTPDEWRKAGLAGVNRVIRAFERNRKPRYGCDPNVAYDDAIHGAAAEIAFAKHLGVPWVDSPELDYDGDVGRGRQVRWTRYSSGKLILHPEDYGNHRFVLATGRLPTIRLMGWVTGDEGKREVYWGSLQEGDARPAYWVPQEALRDLRTFPPEEVIA